MTDKLENNDPFQFIPGKAVGIMSRSMLFALKPLSESDILIPKAVEFARQQELLIDGISVIDEQRLAPRQPVPPGGGAFKQASDRHAIAMGRESAAALMAELSNVAGTQNVECKSHIAEGDVSLVLTAAVQRCDLMVCSATPDANARERSLLSSLLDRSPRPVLVFSTKPDEPRDVLVAYDGSLQAARALAAFVSSGIWKNREVHLVTVESKSGDLAEHAEAARIFLQRHEIPHQFHIRESSRNVGQDLIEEVKRLEVGLVVLGTCGKSVVREFFLGSVARTLLDTLPASLFLNH